MARGAQQQVPDLVCDRAAEQRLRIEAGAARDSLHDIVVDGGDHGGAPGRIDGREPELRGRLGARRARGHDAHDQIARAAHRPARMRGTAAAAVAPVHRDAGASQCLRGRAQRGATAGGIRGGHVVYADDDLRSAGQRG